MNLEARLTEDEKGMIHDSKDLVYAELIKAMSLDELKWFDSYKPKNQLQYNLKQREWILTDKYYLTQKLGHEPTEAELMHDYCEVTHNALRYKALYVLKYPHMVERYNK